MINVNELRAGNLIYKGHIPCVVTAELLVEISKGPKETYAPIAIDETWLLEMGFHEQVVRGYNIKSCLKLHLSKERDYYVFYVGPGLHGKSPRQFRYLHELQNFYYAFTGNELELKSRS